MQLSAFAGPLTLVLSSSSVVFRYKIATSTAFFLFFGTLVAEQRDVREDPATTLPLVRVSSLADSVRMFRETGYIGVSLSPPHHGLQRCLRRNYAQLSPCQCRGSHCLWLNASLLQLAGVVYQCKAKFEFDTV